MLDNILDFGKRFAAAVVVAVLILSGMALLGWLLFLILEVFGSIGYIVTLIIFMAFGITLLTRDM